jgi:hypothetical protein
MVALHSRSRSLTPQNSPQCGTHAHTHTHNRHMDKYAASFPRFEELDVEGAGHIHVLKTEPSLWVISVYRRVSLVPAGTPVMLSVQNPAQF